MVFFTLYNLWNSSSEIFLKLGYFWNSSIRSSPQLADLERLHAFNRAPKQLRRFSGDAPSWDDVAGADEEKHETGIVSHWIDFPKLFFLIIFQTSRLDHSFNSLLLNQFHASQTTPYAYVWSKISGNFSEPNKQQAQFSGRKRKYWSISEWKKMCLLVVILMQDRQFRC